MGLFDFIKKDSKEKEHQQNMDIALGKTGQISKNALSNIMKDIQDQKDLEKIAIESTIDQARMWAAGALENEMIKNYVYGIMKHESSDSLIRMAANQKYRDITDEEYHKLAEMFTERTGLPAWKCENMYVARMAVAEITDANVLNEIINGKNYRIEFEAKKRLIEITKEQKERLETAAKRVPESGIYLPDDKGATKNMQEKKLKRENINECVKGDFVTFGKWNGEPLLWRVLSVEDDKLLLITEKCLEAKPFDVSGGGTWDTCSLRSELNGEYFYLNPGVFSETERNAILLTTTDSPGIYYQNKRDFKEYYGKSGSEVQDYVFLLNVSEACKYFNASSKGVLQGMGFEGFDFPQDESLSTDAPWWLRNSTRGGTAAVVVTAYGLINYNGFTVSEAFTPQIRPAIWIKK